VLEQNDPLLAPKHPLSNGAALAWLPMKSQVMVDTPIVTAS
jgi:hypothetical protein